MAITVADKAKWEKAIEKARSEKPRVKVLDFGKFEVCGKGGCYTVSWTGKGAEMKATCSCKAALANRPCYHVPSTSGAWKLQVIERAEKARLSCSECNEEAIEDTGLCEFHLELSELSKAFSTPVEGLPLVSATVECSQCGEEYPEADMSGPGYAPVCPNCLLFG